MNPANAAACAEAGIATGGGASGAGGTSGGGGVIAGILSALGLERLVQRSDSAGSAADKIKEGTSPSTGSKSGNGDVHPGGQEAADAAWDSIKGVGETKRYEDRHGNVTGSRISMVVVWLTGTRVQRVITKVRPPLRFVMQKVKLFKPRAMRRVNESGIELR